jgi:hypothetical protein
MPRPPEPPQQATPSLAGQLGRHAACSVTSVVPRSSVVHPQIHRKSPQMLIVRQFCPLLVPGLTNG